MRNSSLILSRARNTFMSPSATTRRIMPNWRDSSGVMRAGSIPAASNMAAKSKSPPPLIGARRSTWGGGTFGAGGGRERRTIEWIVQ